VSVPEPIVRPRRPDDVPLVAELLMRQQPLTRYPYRNPLPFPVEEFVVRPGELGAWVAELAPGAGPVGHVSAVEVDEHHLAPRWAGAVGRPVSDLAAVSVLVVDPEVTGRGVARSLLDVCEQHLLDLGRVPVLEVLSLQQRAADLYRARGWRAIGEDEPDWLPPGTGLRVTLMVLDPA
jgi:GNAT superfamily N-acetyltransferase